MKTNPTPVAPAVASRQPLMLAVIAFVLGIALTAVWFHKHENNTAAGSGGISPATVSLLQQLPAPVTIHFYALLPAGSSDATLSAFAARVTQLLKDVSAVSGGKISVTTFDQPSNASSTAASADGIQPFNLDRGDACYLGLAIASGGHNEALARLAPEWEAALESDLARTIQRVTAVAAPAPPAPEVARPSPAIVASIKELIPDVSTVTVEQASQIFHADFLQRCNAAGAEMEKQIGAASQKVVAAQAAGNDADLEAARKNLAQVQLDQAEKLKAIAANLQTQLAVFQRMKAGATNTAK